MNEHEKTRMIAVEQLCVGLYVYLDISWMQHTFSRNSFKIKSLEEIGEIRSLGLKEIRVNPRLSEGPPLPLLAGAMVAAAPAAHEPSANGIESLHYKKKLGAAVRRATNQCAPVRKAILEGDRVGQGHFHAHICAPPGGV